jgi:hypothetical protein
MASPTAASQFLSGIPIAVDPEEIERELARLWKSEVEEEPRAAPPAAAQEEVPAGAREAGNPSVTRACLSNLLFYLPEAGDRDRAARTVAEVGRRFPSRVFLLTLGEGKSGESPLSAWVTAVCHLTVPGSPPVCCEQITLEARGRPEELFPGEVVPLLVPDVPVVLVLLSHLEESLLGFSKKDVERVIFDSREWAIPSLARLLGLLERNALDQVDDLGWRDTNGWRRAICDVFDEEAARRFLWGLERVEVEYQEAGSAGPGRPASGNAEAALLAGWLASRLGWLEARIEKSGSAATLTAEDGRKLQLRLKPGNRPWVAPGQIGSVLLAFGHGPHAPFLRLARSEEREIYRIEYHTPETCVLPRTILFRQETDAELLGAALERSTHQEVFRGALKVAARLA